ncbi:MAG: outer membrane beta-barrel protein, partial [Candidatus Aegiribacteria sp.]|nr:outer membrane beta-barrel protein [Candidatus Aegiribacteria sp.]
IVNLVGKEGGDRYRGSLITRYSDITTASFDSRDKLFMEQTDNSFCRRGLSGFEGTVSGPEPLTELLLPSVGVDLPGEVRFSTSGQISVSGRDTVDTRGRWENNWRTDVSGIAKLTYKPMNRTSFSFSILGSYRERGWNEWAWSRYHLPAYIEGSAYLGRSQDHALPVRFSETSGLIFNVTQLFGSETCLKMTLGRMKFQDWHRVRSEDGDYIGENTNPTYWLTLYHPEELVTDSLGFYHTGVHPNVWFDSKAEVSSMAFGIDHNPNSRTRLKAGVSARYYDLYQYNVYSESPVSTYVSRWSAYPHSGSGFLQGSYRFSGGVIATAGLRMDLFNANASYFDPESEDMVEVESKWALSPRVGISVPFGENSVFFTSYGHHFQIPSMECLYVQTSYNLAQDRIVSGNPDLDPESTQTFEVGVRHYLDMTTQVSLAAYYKDITGLISTEDHYEGTYYVFTNDDSHGMARGLEFSLERSAGSNISGQLLYAISVAKGRYSSILEKYNYAQEGVYYISNEDNYLDWDQTHTLRASLALGTNRDEGPRLMGFRIFENTRLGIDFSYGSGVPYTLPPSSGDLVETNTERYPEMMQTDVTLSRSAGLGPAELEVTLGVYNVFNRHNVVQIYDTALFHSTGDPGGELGNPRAWSPARHFALTAGISW